MRATTSLIKVKSSSALLHMPLTCIRSYLNSFLRHKYLILDNHHSETLYLREQGCDDLLMVIRRNPKLPASNEFWETLG